MAECRDPKHILLHFHTRNSHDAPKKLAGLFDNSDTGLFFTPVNALVFNALVAVVHIIIGFATKTRQESFTQLRTKDFSKHLAV
jgi:hypothetical protein